MYGLRSLKNLFPNLAVIRGQSLFKGYALVMYEMRDLEEVGLISLTTILKGAVNLSKNFRLCFVSSIDWKNLTVSAELEDSRFDVSIFVCYQIFTWLFFIIPEKKIVMKRKGIDEKKGDKIVFLLLIDRLIFLTYIFCEKCTL